MLILVPRVRDIADHQSPSPEEKPTREHLAV